MKFYIGLGNNALESAVFLMLPRDVQYTLSAGTITTWSITFDAQGRATLTAESDDKKD